MIDGSIYTVYVVVIVMITYGLIRLIRMRALFRQPRLPQKILTLDTTPSVSVCIPARNESHAMTDCLNSVIASTYPKLEVIVLDDQSGDKTSSLIKAYAHDGVRFVEGKALRDGWLGKNHALNELLVEASGTYVLFMDVDTKVLPDTITQLVSYAESEKALMVSVLPRREDGVRMSMLFSPLRYMWELLFHDKKRPAVASSAWMVRRADFLQQFKDFESLRDHIQPEATIARTWAATSQYRLIIGTAALGVSYEKKWTSQKDTSVRLLFPLLGSRLYRSAAAVFDLALLLAPITIVAFLQDTIHVYTAVVLYLYAAVFFYAYYHQVWRRGALLGAIIWPVIVLQEIWLIMLSSLRYKQERVTWKGRPVRLGQKI